MANHGFSPSTNFTYEEPGVYRLRAMKDMRAGEEVRVVMVVMVVVWVVVVVVVVVVVFFAPSRGAHVLAEPSLIVFIVCGVAFYNCRQPALCICT